jgi:hypothetical protein
MVTWVRSRVNGESVGVTRPPTTRWIWCVSLGLTGVLLAVVTPRLAKQWPYWLATHRGEGARLGGANLIDADLSRVKLKGANLRRASLIKARCFDTDFRHADLSGADLSEALLAGADLRGATMGDARLTNAVYDRSTRWPADYHPEEHGAVRANWDEKIWRAFGRPPRR